MSEEKEVEIINVTFLTPAKVKYKKDGVLKEEIVGVDFVNRKLYDNSSLITSEDVFEHLDRVNGLPEDFFRASEDVYGSAMEAKREHDEIYNNTGGLDV